ncbi:MAG: HEAT repeat domain-containing protein [Merismopedia sp. SIO2A8]|nr:HEAT repeat domain-containing protein [Merismopedia sp. SIO2A8]
MLQSQAQTDALLQTVNEQIDTLTFDPNDQQLLERMVESLGDTRGMVRLSIAETLGQIGEPATPFLTQKLANHPNPVVRRACAKTLTLIADPTAVPVLLNSFLNDEDTVVRGSAVGALARTGEAAVPALLEIIASPQHPESTKGHAAWALAFIGAEAKDYLYNAIASDSNDVRCAAVGAIASLVQEQGDEHAFKVLISSLSDTAPAVRAEAAAALGKLDQRSAVPELILCLRDTDSEVRKTVALALMKLGDSMAIEHLQAALDKETEAAVGQVIKLAISQLEKKLDEDDWES